MATWVIGDVHGCLGALLELVEVIGFDPKHDRLWLVGDLVNRGPDSLGVLRWASRREGAVSAVLGNHDLKLLACAAGVSEVREGKDTFGDVLAAPDREELIEWLARRPLAVPLDGHLLVHAGLLPGWDLDEALDLARAGGRVLAGDERAAFLACGGWKKPGPMPKDGGTLDRMAAAAGIFTGIRIVDHDGIPDAAYTGPVETIPPGFRPWYRGARILDCGRTVVFGHWAAHGARRLPGAVCLDSACLYGGALTALRLEDGAARSVPCPRSRPPRS